MQHQRSCRITYSEFSEKNHWHQHERFSFFFLAVLIESEDGSHFGSLSSPSAWEEVYHPTEWWWWWWWGKLVVLTTTKWPPGTVKIFQSSRITVSCCYQCTDSVYGDRAGGDASLVWTPVGHHGSCYPQTERPPCGQDDVLIQYLMSFTITSLKHGNKFWGIWLIPVNVKPPVIVMIRLYLNIIVWMDKKAPMNVEAHVQLHAKITPKFKLKLL